MRKFLETYQIDVEDLRGSFSSEYMNLFYTLQDLQDKITPESSAQVQEEYISLLQSVDDFLMKPENIERLKEKIPQLELFDETVEFSEDEARVRLEKEIAEMTSEIDESELQEQIKVDKTKQKKGVIDSGIDKVVKRSDLDEELQYYGVKFEYQEIKEDNFARCLSMLKAGAKFWYKTLGNKHYVVFKFNDRHLLIIQTPNPTTNYRDIMGGGEGEVCYLIAPTQQKLERFFTIFRYAIDSEYSEYEDVPQLDDDFLFGSPLIKGAYFNFLYTPAQKFAQPEKIVQEDKYLKIYFSWFFALEKILTLILIKANKMRIDGVSERKYAIEEQVEALEYRFEGFGDVPHTKGKNSVLETLRKNEIIDSNYEMTSLSKGVLRLNSRMEYCHPDFKAFMYYRVDLKEKFKTSKQKYYSDFNGNTLFHIKDDINKINIAISLPGQYQQQWGFEKSEQLDIFTPEWQSSQEFDTWVEYLPFACSNEIVERSRSSEKNKRGYLAGKMNFADDYKFKMYIASVFDPAENWSINSSLYNFVKQMYSDRNIRIMGPQIYGQVSSAVFFSLVDENNNVLAILPGGNKTQETDSSGQIKIGWESDEISVADVPGPVWSFDDLINDLKGVAPGFIENGESIKEAISLDNTISPEGESELSEGSDDSEDLKTEIPPAGLPDDDEMIDLDFDDDESLKDLPDDPDEYISKYIDEEAEKILANQGDDDDYEPTPGMEITPGIDLGAKTSQEDAQEQESIAEDVKETEVAGPDTPATEEEKEESIQKEVEEEVPELSPADEIQREIDLVEDEINGLTREQADRYDELDSRLEELYDKLDKLND